MALIGAAVQQDLASVVDAIGEAIYSVSIEGIVLSWNPAAEELYGYSAADVVGQSADHLVPADRSLDDGEHVARLLAGASSVEHFDTERLTAAGGRIHVQLTMSPVPGADGQPRALAILARDVSARKHVERRLDRIHELTIALSQALTRPEAVDAVLRELRRSGIRRGWLGLVEEASLRAVRPEGVLGFETMPDIADSLDEIGFDDVGPLTNVAARGEPVWFARGSDLVARFPARSAQVQPFSQSASTVLPLLIDDRTIGVLALGLAGEGPFDEADKSYYLSIAQQCAQAIERARLFDAERAARAAAELAAGRQANLRAIGELVGRTVMPGDVIQVLLSEGIRAFGAVRGAVVLLEEDALEVAGAYGYPEDLAERFGRVPLGASSPAAEAVRSGTPIFLEDQEALAAAYPLALETGVLVSAAAAYVPISVAGEPIGAIAIGYDEPYEFGPEDRALLEILSGQFAQAIARTRLQDAERAAKARGSFLAEASAKLASSIDYVTAVGRVLRLAVPTIADYALATVVDESGRVVNLTPVREAEGVATEDDAGIPAFPDGAGATLVRDVEDEVADDRLTADQVRFLRRLDARSAMIVPLVAHGEAFGSIAFLTTRTGRRFGHTDLSFAEDLARRVSSAIENARLYDNLRRLARAERAQAAELAAVIQAIGEPVIVFDPLGRVRLANQAAGAIFGAGRIERLPDLAARFEAPDQLPTLAEGKRGPVELRLRGVERWFELRAYPVQPVDLLVGESLAPREGIDPEEALSMILLGRDVTAIRQASHVREAFIGMLSHELRTPITTIYGGTRILRRHGLSEHARREVFADITDEAERLHRLVEDLLVLARAERGGLEIGGEPVLLQHVLPRVVESEAAHWPATRIRMDVPGMMPPVSADPTYVEQVVRNLL
ncbi:MAG TPA: GAF domain-containing protein, partial [Candidatus Limnocylindrales bacterium]